MKVLVALIAATAAEEYIVQFREDAFEGGIANLDKAQWVAAVLDNGGGIASSSAEVTDDWSLPGFEAFAGTFSQEEIDTIEAQDEVEFVEKSQTYTITGPGSQNNPTWGLDRIDDRTTTDRTYQWNDDGEGATVYVIDTGIQTNHRDFGGRASFGADFTGEGSGDGNGHGTHVAGTAMSRTYGVAKAARAVAVKVLNRSGSGSTQGVINGINWVARNARSRSVANMSLGGGASRAIDNAVAGAVRAGVTMVVAAGNENQNACNVSPARAPSAITVAASNRSDRRASFSNWGNCVDIFAPGQDITSTWRGSSTATRTISGTSMAAPHVAGVAAIYLGGSNLSPSQVTSRLNSRASTNEISDPRGSPNRLLYSL